MSLKAGGHLSHGAKASLTGRAWRPTHYGVHRETERIDLDEVRDLVRRVRPKMLICGASAYPRRIDYEGFRAVADEFGCLLMTDMAHIAGLVAAKVLPSPVPTCDFVTSTTTKTLRGARGGFILCRGRFADAIDRAIFPGTQGGPILQNLAAKGTTFRLAGTRAFAEYAARTVANARVLAERLTERGWRIVTGGTDNHLVLADVRPKGTTGDAAEAVLESVGLLVNKNSIPFDPNPPVSPSGVRLGTAALSTRGFTPDAMARVADLIDGAVTRREDGTVLTAIREEVRDLARAFPLYLGFGEGEAL
jgi:glycine hydroxymethyltransferase